MSGGAKKFYKSADVREDTAGFSVLLDGRAIKTPAGKAFVAPTRKLGEAIAAEWGGQGERVVPESMPLTKALNTAIDRIGSHRKAVIDDLAKYAGSDLLCYRASDPQDLVRRQAAVWDPWVDWAHKTYGARLTVVTGMTHVEQPPEALQRLHRAVEAHDDYRLVALHAGVTITGSAVLGLAFAAKALTAERAFIAAHVDEDYQADRWGRDAEAETVRARRLGDLKAAETFLALLD